MNSFIRKPTFRDALDAALSAGQITFTLTQTSDEFIFTASNGPGWGPNDIVTESALRTSDPKVPLSLLTSLFLKASAFTDLSEDTDSDLDLEADAPSGGPPPHQMLQISKTISLASMGPDGYLAASLSADTDSSDPSWYDDDHWEDPDFSDDRASSEEDSDCSSEDPTSFYSGELSLPQDYPNPSTEDLVLRVSEAARQLRESDSSESFPLGDQPFTPMSEEQKKRISQLAAQFQAPSQGEN